MNGHKIPGKRIREIDIIYFFITDRVEKVNVDINHCPTGVMIADSITKPLQGSKFQAFGKSILGM